MELKNIKYSPIKLHSIFLNENRIGLRGVDSISSDRLWDVFTMWLMSTCGKFSWLESFCQVLKTKHWCPKKGLQRKGLEKTRETFLPWTQITTLRLKPSCRMSQSPELNPATQPETVSQPPSLSTPTAWQDFGLLNLDWWEIIWRLQHNKIWKKVKCNFSLPCR